MNTVLWGVIAYLVIQFGIGIYVSRRIRTESDYIVAGRRLGYGLATFTIFATWFGAETTIGSAGAVYQSGLSGATSDPFGYAVCLFLMGLIFAVPLWRMKLTTLAIRVTIPKRCRKTSFGVDLVIFFITSLYHIPVDFAVTNW